MNEETIFFQLLKYLNELEKNQKYLMKEDPKAFAALSKFLVRMEDNLHWEVKHEYIELIGDFLDGNIEADDFSIIFMRMYEKGNEKLQQLKQDVKEKNNLNPSFQSSKMSKLVVKSKASEVGGLLSRLYGNCDSFNPDPSSRTLIQLDQEELRNCAKTAFLEMQKYFDE
jgi:hypothetical protein